MGKPEFIVFSLCVLMGMSACKNAPIDTLIIPSTPNTTSAWLGGVFPIYDDEIKTGGAVQLFTTLAGTVLDFDNVSNPHQGMKCIKYSWDGSDVVAFANGQTEHGFVGFSLIAAPTVDQAATVSRNLLPGGYTKLSLWVRGTLSSGVSLLVKGNNPATDVFTSNSNDKQITGDWKHFEFPIDTSSLAVTRDFVQIILTFDSPNIAQGNGGTVYIDDISLVR